VNRTMACPTSKQTSAMTRMRDITHQQRRDACHR
jgi:hypothetical protein